MRKETQNLLKGLMFISPWLIGFAVFTVLPIGLSLYYSFTDYSLLQSPAGVGTANYQELFQDKYFWKSLKNTFYYASLSLPLGLIIALLTALLLNANIRGRSIYRTIIFLPSLVPAVASSMLWLWLLNTQLGLVNLMLEKIGVDNPPGWLDSPGYWAMPSIVFMGLWGIGNTVVIYLAGLQDVPRELYEAAELDGAGWFGKLINVTLPVISPVIFFNLIMAIIGSMQNFIAPFTMTGGGPEKSTYMYTQFLYDHAFSYLHMGYASALAWIQLLIVMGLTGIAFWSSKRWVHYQGK